MYIASFDSILLRHLKLFYFCKVRQLLIEKCINLTFPTSSPHDLPNTDIDLLVLLNILSNKSNKLDLKYFLLLIILTLKYTQIRLRTLHYKLLQ